MNRILLKYNIVSIVPFEETYFFKTGLPKNIDMSQELLEFNYSKYSPFIESKIISKAEDKSLMLWFYEKKYDSKILIPESYLLYTVLKEEKKDCIYIIKGEKTKILIIRDNILVSTYVSDNYDDTMLAVAMNQYQISQKKIIDNEEYKKIYQAGLKQLTILEILKWNKNSFDSKSALVFSVNKYAYYIAAVLAVSVTVNMAHINYLDKRINELENIYLEKKNSTMEIKESTRQYNKSVERVEEFIDKELVYSNSVYLLEKLYTILEKNDSAVFYNIEFIGGKVILRIKTDSNPVKYLNRISAIKEFSSVIISNTNKHKKDTAIVTYDIVLKSLKDI